MKDESITTRIFSTIEKLKEPNGPERYKALTVVLLLVVVMQWISLSNGSMADMKCNSNKDDDIKQQGDNIISIILFRIVFWGILLFVTVKSYRFWKGEFELFYRTKLTDKDNEFSGMEYFFYRLDYLYSHDDKFKPFALLAVTIFLIVVGGVLWWLSTGDSLFESFWNAWTFVADPGTHADNTGLMPRLVSFLMTLGGMVIFAMVIGMITEDIGSFVDNLRRGKSRVIVSNHTLILGQVAVRSPPPVLSLLSWC